jgi:hypothetical protein
MTLILDWLLEGPAWVQYRALVDLQGLPESDPRVALARRDMLADAQVQGVIAELTGWPGVVLNSHKSASQHFHKLNFLADLGLRVTDPGMDVIAGKVMAHASPDGPFGLPMNIPVHFGGSGEDAYAWALCDAPNLVYALLKLGLGGEPAVQRASITWSGCAGKTVFPALCRRSWGSSGDRGAKTTPALTPPWQCSRRWGRRRSLPAAPPAAAASKPCSASGKTGVSSTPTCSSWASISAS